MFGKTKEKFQQNTPFYPVEGPAVFQKFLHIDYKLQERSGEGYYLLVMEVLFNHESPIRGETFVTKKIIQGLIKNKKESKKLFLGNLYSKRD